MFGIALWQLAVLLGGLLLASAAILLVRDARRVSQAVAPTQRGATASAPPRAARKGVPAPSAAKQQIVVYAGPTSLAAIAAAMPAAYVTVSDRKAFDAATRRPGVAFVDVTLLSELDDQVRVPVIGIMDDSAGTGLPEVVRTLGAFPWLSQVITSSMLAAPQASTSIATLLELLAAPDQPLLSTNGVGRVALLAEADHREARFERIESFFSKHGLSSKTIRSINEVCEELVMNALYDAPVEAGYFPDAISREQNVVLPPDRACEISYGIEGGNVFVRVRDTFGSLSRTRLIDVLRRCSTSEVVLDESRGGAGLGLWRIFSVASSIIITVIPGHITDIVVRISTQNGRITKKLQAVHLFFAPASEVRELPEVPEVPKWLDQSVTLIRVT
jgi:hypothetical protein